MKKLPGFPCEWIVGAFCLLTLTLFAYFGVPLRNPFQLYWTRIVSGVALYVCALIIQLLLLRLDRIHTALQLRKEDSWQNTLQEFRTSYLRGALLLRDFRFLNVLSLTFVAFINAKHIVPFLTVPLGQPLASATDRIWDSQLYGLESQLFGAGLLSEKVVHFFGTGSAEFWSGVYTLFYPYVAIVLFVVLVQRRIEITQEYYATFVLVWFLGIVWVYAMPTWGPCYWIPETLRTFLPVTDVTNLQTRLWEMKLAMDQNPKSPVGAFMISGVPSLHVAVAAHGSYYLRFVSTRLSILSWVFTSLTVISTLYFGWHYLLDDIAAMVLVVLAIFVAKPISKMVN